VSSLVVPLIGEALFLLRTQSNMESGSNHGRSALRSFGSEEMVSTSWTIERFARSLIGRSGTSGLRRPCHCLVEAAPGRHTGQEH
ncbi:MAG TPA: hypothetical protein VJS18_02480, partial [Paraburkholderia sp.]|nr:hypothetical protein [Paraburkholderia sp.]